MSLVIITGDDAEHHYVANKILAAHEVLAIFVCDPSKRRSWRSVLRKSPRRFLDKVLRQLFLRAIDAEKMRHHSLSHVLGEQSTAFSRPDLVVRVGPPKAGVLTEKVAEIAPDVIAVYGTGIIPDEVLELAGTVSLNMHTGLSPWYRGTACAFWPIVKGEPDKIGATVHECTSDVDGGRIFFRGRANLYRGDDLHAILGRAVVAGANGYVDVISKALDGTLSGEPQDLSIGTEYRGEMLGFWAEISARRSLQRVSKSWPEESP